MPRECRKLCVQGVVQGVGFRPFVYREATLRSLSGSVRNLGNAGVEILLEGDTSAIEAFIKALREQAPPLARIASIVGEPCELTGARSFTIDPSGGGDAGRGSIPPDTAICTACVGDILGDSRYHGYWATSCTNCGPRFTVIEGLPYDRPLTSMMDFPMCEPCAREYIDPVDRRYHAQTIACETCGPRLAFDGAGEAPVRLAAAALRAGKIVAIKGIGGTHVACDATHEAALLALRERLGRPGQPFALMATEEVLARFAEVDSAERELLRSPQRPIVVLRQKEGVLPAGVAPGLHTVGVMLPYSGLHELLLREVGLPLVMTSANLPGRPMLIDNEEITARLSSVADHRLLHNRRIVARCDDSVRRRSGGKTLFLRRSRGYVPEAIEVDLGAERILALGPETGVAFTLYANGAATMSQHIGSVDNVETYEFLLQGIEHLKRLTGFGVAGTVACDLHPRFLTTQLARRLQKETGARVVPVQHHVAHVASVMGEHGVESSVGIVLDGYGFGTDGTAWGGELFAAENGVVERAGSLRAVRLPGGDEAARHPLRVAAALLHEAGVPEKRLREQLSARGLVGPACDALLTQIERGVNAPWTTSAGRFLDAVAAWLGICTERTYEGEPAMRLEALATRGMPAELDVRVVRRGRLFEVDTIGLFRTLVDLAESATQAEIAATAQALLAEGISRAATELAQERGMEVVGLSGGVAYNDAIAGRIRERIEAAGLRFVTNERTPCGDGGVSFGQAVFAGRGWRMLEADRPDAASGE